MSDGDAVLWCSDTYICTHNYLVHLSVSSCQRSSSTSPFASALYIGQSKPHLPNMSCFIQSNYPPTTAEYPSTQCTITVLFPSLPWQTHIWRYKRKKLITREILIGALKHVKCQSSTFWFVPWRKTHIKCLLYWRIYIWKWNSQTLNLSSRLSILFVLFSPKLHYFFLAARSISFQA
jgi:hypothetical protein